MNITLTLHPSKVDAAPHIVLIHGMGSAATAWKPLTPHLLDRFNVITVDLPGHGQSLYTKGQPMDPYSIAKAVVKEVEKEFGISKFDLVGNSWGGWITLEMAAHFPANIRSVTALAPAGFWLASYVQRAPGTAMLQFLAKNSALLAPVYLKYEWARKLGFADVSPHWRTFSQELCLDATMAMAKSSGYFPAWDGMLSKRFDSKIDQNIPVKIIFGDSDRTLPATTCQEQAMAPEHSKWITIAECGHAPMWDQVESVKGHIFEIAGKSQ
jgi:pimeloyl-ACP methyl ester carboxylesterase